MHPLVQHADTVVALLTRCNNTRQRILSFQEKKLRSVLRHAFNKVPYYHKRFNEVGITPRDIRSKDDLRHIPISSSADYKQQPLRNLLARNVNPKRLVAHTTSGSSGRPRVIYRTKLEEHLMNQFRIRADRQLGVKATDKVAAVLLVQLKSKGVALPKGLRPLLGLNRSETVDCLQPREHVLRSLEAMNPDMIHGYPGFLAHFAPLPEESGQWRIQPQRIVTGGESLTPFRRERIESGFNAPVYDTYAANEFNLLAWQCPNSGYYHVCDDNIILEIVHNGKPATEGEAGEVVATGLHGYGMPFIRYRMGDIAVKGPELCPCGLPYSTLLKISGRIQEYFLINRQKMHANEIMIPIIIHAGHWIDQYRIIQRTETSVTLYIKPIKTRVNFPDDWITRSAEKKLGSGIDFRLKIVDNIPFEASGKFRLSRSYVISDQ